MQEYRLQVIQAPKFVPKITDNKHGKRVCQNLFLNQSKIVMPNQGWISDITYIASTNELWTY